MSHKVLIVGPRGGREAALAWKFQQDGDKVYVTNPSGGIADENIAKNAAGEALDQFDDKGLAEFAKTNEIELAVVAGDDAQAKGIVDKLHKAGIAKVFGAKTKPAKLESSKAFAKQAMTEAGVATAGYKIFYNSQTDQAKSYIRKRFVENARGLVIKASGLAQGKGAIVTRSQEEALAALDKIKKDFPEAGKTIVIEELLEGKEFSVHALADSKGNTVVFPLVADYKAVGDGDVGENTGGMGVVGFLQKGSQKFLDQIKATIVDPIINLMKAKGMPFVGLLYPGLMQKDAEQPQVLEYNARFGDPETQVYMRLLDDNCKLFDVLDACISGTLSADKIKWKESQHAISVTLAAEGYPGTYEKGKEITGIAEAEKIDDRIKVFHAGTAMKDGKLITNGGRVLHVTAIGSSLEEARKLAYLAVDKIQFEGKTYRTDIGAAGTRE